MIDAEPEEDETHEKLESGARAPAAEAAVQHEISETRCKVYLKKPEKKTFISVEDYTEQELGDIDQSDEITKLIYTCRTITRLEEMNIVKEDWEELAEILMDGGEVKFKAGTICKSSDLDPEVYAGEYYRKFSKEVKIYQCLLISAPSKQVDSLEQYEMKNFCLQAFPPKLFDAAAVEDLTICHEVSRPEEIRKLIQNFFRLRKKITAKRAMHALIVFFGHGGKSGYCVGEKRVPLDDIIDNVKEEWAEALKIDPKWLPVRVKIIFAHCYSHVHPKYDKDFKVDRFHVVSLTSDEHPLAYSVKNAEGKYYVKQLKAYIDKYLGPEIVATEVLSKESEQTKRTEPGDSVVFPGVSNSGRPIHRSI